MEEGGEEGEREREEEGEGKDGHQYTSQAQAGFSALTVVRGSPG